MWPPLPLEGWRDTRDTLHRFTQIVGKIQLALTPLVNQFWNVTLRVTARGLATSVLPYEGRTFDIELDLVDHRVVIRTSLGERRTIELRPAPVAELYRELMATLASLGIDVPIWDHPVEIATDAIPFSEDRLHAAYDREAVARFFRVLSGTSSLLETFRSRFIGKCSGVGFYWGTFDLSVARYSGRRARGAPTKGVIEREAYSHEVSEAGFWPGDSVYRAPAFFALQFPAPEAYARTDMGPGASWQSANSCFVLPYEAVRHEPDAAAQILAFYQRTYEAGATLAGWDRAALERQEDTMSNDRDPHLSAAHHVDPTTTGCAECLKLGISWVHLRVCLTCGHIGCCDSSVGKHATAHFQATGHPVVESFEPGEDWGWCYLHANFVELPDNLLVDKR